MPITLDTTVGGASADSYIAVVDADTYFGRRLGATAWTGASDDGKAQALIMAADRLQLQNWLGGRVTTTQRLAWPRIGVAKVDSIGGGIGCGYPYGYGPFEYLMTEIPQPVKDAQCELALSLLARGADPVQNGRRVKSFSADGLSVQYEHGGLLGSLPAEALGLIGGLIAGSRLVRA